jgi:hypothetical protein
MQVPTKDMFLSVSHVSHPCIYLPPQHPLTRTFPEVERRPSLYLKREREDREVNKRRFRSNSHIVELPCQHVE